LDDRLLHCENDDQRCQWMQQAGNGKHRTIGYARNHVSQAERDQAGTERSGTARQSMAKATVATRSSSRYRFVCRAITSH
jgi:hypothetical protein